MELDTETGKARIIKVDGKEVIYKPEIPQIFLDCIDCDFASDSSCNWYPCEKHDDEFTKWEMKNK